MANDIDIAVDELVKVKGYAKQIESMFAKLMQRSPEYYEYKKKWLLHKRISK